MLCPVAHDDLGGPIVELVIGGQFFRKRLAQFRDASAGCIFCEPSFQRLNRRPFDMFRGIKIRFACAEAANIDPFSFHGLGLAINRECERRTELSGTFGNFHGSGTNGEIVQNGSASYWRR